MVNWNLERIKVSGQQVRRGGLLGFSGYLDIIKKEFGERVLLLDAGDLLHGSYTSNHGYGAAMIVGLNSLGFHASAIGNHEFDFDPATRRPRPQRCFKDRIQEASFPFGCQYLRPCYWESYRLADTQASRLLDLEA